MMRWRLASRAPRGPGHQAGAGLTVATAALVVLSSTATVGVVFTATQTPSLITRAPSQSMPILQQGADVVQLPALRPQPAPAPGPRPVPDRDEQALLDAEQVFDGDDSAHVLALAEPAEPSASAQAEAADEDADEDAADIEILAIPLEPGEPAVEEVTRRIESPTQVAGVAQNGASGDDVGAGGGGKNASVGSRSGSSPGSTGPVPPSAGASPDVTATPTATATIEATDSGSATPTVGTESPEADASDTATVTVIIEPPVEDGAAPDDGAAAEEPAETTDETEPLPVPGDGAGGQGAGDDVLRGDATGGDETGGDATGGGGSGAGGAGGWGDVPGQGPVEPVPDGAPDAVRPDDPPAASLVPGAEDTDVAPAPVAAPPQPAGPTAPVLGSPPDRHAPLAPAR